MMEQVNLSRLSHGVRAAAMMRRCLNEAMVLRATAAAFGQAIIEYPLLRRQLLKIAAADRAGAVDVRCSPPSAMDRANAGRQEADSLLRILTPLLKFRACRDNIPVATGAMEVRGGNGYIEEWVNARLVRDAHIGVLWEGTSNINALDIVTRAVGKSRAHQTLEAALGEVAGGGKRQYRRLSGIAFALRLTGRWPSPSASQPSRRCEQTARLAASAPLSRHQRHPDDVGGARPGQMRAGPCMRGSSSNTA